MSERKRPTVGFWGVVIVVALLVLYPLSLVPACWVATRCDSMAHQQPFRWFATFYGPVLVLLLNAPEATHGPVAACLGLGAPAGREPYFFYYGRKCGLAWNGPGYSYTMGSMERY